MYIHMFSHIHTFIYTCVDIHTFTHVFMYIHMITHIHTFIHTCVDIHTFAHVYSRLPLFQYGGTPLADAKTGL